jgi:hypothetical protein
MTHQLALSNWPFFLNSAMGRYPATMSSQPCNIILDLRFAFGSWLMSVTKLGFMFLKVVPL